MRKTITALLLAGAIALPGLAMAQPQDDHRGDDRPHGDWRGGGRPAHAPAPAAPPPAPPPVQAQGQAQARIAPPQFQRLQGAPGIAGGGPRPDWQGRRDWGGPAVQRAPGFTGSQPVQPGIDDRRRDDWQRRDAYRDGAAAARFGDQQRLEQQRAADQQRLVQQRAYDQGRFNQQRAYDQGRLNQQRAFDAQRGDWQRREAYRDGRADGWNRAWRTQQSYDWQRYRAENRYAYHLPRYYAPYGWGYGYQRFGIGITLSNVLFAEDYWIDDPYDYRLPPAYGPYRWVRYYNDALLVDVRTGLVVDTVYDIFW